jgi:hypothetical protein|tara:strand:- start:1637 stop:2482 length:846 start_codon:yes stop_codon:yes gene_type:complete
MASGRQLADAIMGMGKILNFPDPGGSVPKRQRRFGPQGNKSLRDFRRRKAAEVKLEKTSKYAGMTRREEGLAKDRQAQLNAKLEKSALSSRTPEAQWQREGRSIRDLEQRPLGEPRLDTKKAPTAMERTMDNPEAHHILELDFMDSIYNNASPRAKKKLDNKLATFLSLPSGDPNDVQYALKGGDSKANYVVFSKLLHTGKGVGIHQWLKKRGISLSNFKLPDNATDDQRMAMLEKLLTKLSKEGYFEELINRKFSPGKFETDKSAKMKTPQGLSFNSLMP